MLGKRVQVDLKSYMVVDNRYILLLESVKEILTLLAGFGYYFCIAFMPTRWLGFTCGR